MGDFSVYVGVASWVVGAVVLILALARWLAGPTSRNRVAADVFGALAKARDEAREEGVAS